MKINIFRTENRIVNIHKSDRLANKSDIKNNYLIKEDSILDFDKGMFNDEYETLSSEIHKIITEYSNVIDEIEKISKNIKLEQENIRKKLLSLAEIAGYKNDINVVTFLSGFRGAASAYGNTIYYGLEWFVDPDTIGIPRESPIYKYSKRISKDPMGFISNSLVHEFTHLISKDIQEKENPLWHLIEEGRATYIADLIEPREYMFPLDKSEVNWCKENEALLLNRMKQVIEINDEQEYMNFVSPKGNIKGVGCTGYYIGYYLMKQYVKSEKQMENKIKKLITLDSSKDIAKILNTITDM